MGLRSMVKVGRLMGLMTAAASVIVLSTAPANAAAPPSHDTIGGAKAITTVPFSETVDTTEATTDDEDAAVNTTCGAPATNGSVWYTIEASAPAYVVDVAQSDFAPGVIVATGTPGNLTLVTCGPRSVGFEATPGEKYYLMAFSADPAVVGGKLAIEVTASDPPPKVSMNVNDVGKVNPKTGTATISGTFTCIGSADFTVVQGRLSQEQSGGNVLGDFEQTTLPCSGTVKWSVEVTPESGKFKRGLAATIALSAGCNRVGCNVYETLEVVRLR
jgi:hypothetical protein